MHLNKMLAFRKNWCYDETELNMLLENKSGPMVHSYLWNKANNREECG